MNTPYCKYQKWCVDRRCLAPDLYILCQHSSIIPGVRDISKMPSRYYASCLEIFLCAPEYRTLRDTLYLIHVSVLIICICCSGDFYEHNYGISPVLTLHVSGVSITAGIEMETCQSQLYRWGNCINYFDPEVSIGHLVTYFYIWML